ncbi:MAG: ABC transporter substrate-binding protein, partial [Eggerthellaceae bacterium]|nr:ABC transporter substrate-binding protein [Eggerthellaceae bacterium]
VSIPENPQRIAAMDSFSGDVCVMVGAGSQMLGAPGGVLSNELLMRLYPDLPNLSRLSGNKVNMEALLDDGIDVALVKGGLYASGSDTDMFDKFGIPFVVIEYETVEEQMAAIKLIGEVCGGEARQRADALADYYQDTVDMVEQRAVQIADDERVKVFHSINDPLLTDGAGSLGDDWITRTGCIDVSGGSTSISGQGDFDATLEEVFKWDPDVIICNSTNAVELINGNSQWAGLGAVAAGEVYNLPVSMSRWGQRGDPETFLAMLWLGKTMYPQLYEDIDLKETVQAYYRDVIGLEVDDDLWETILAGEGIRSMGTGGESGTGNGGQ